MWNVQDNLNNFQKTIREKNDKTQKPYRWEIKLKILIPKNKKDILEENDIKSEDYRMKSNLLLIRTIQLPYLKYK